MNVIESAGKTRQEAIESGLKQLDVTMEDVERIDVLDEGSKGFLGFGARPARVRLTVEGRAESVRPERDRGQRGRRSQQSSDSNRGGEDNRPPRESQSDRQDRGRRNNRGGGGGDRPSDNRGRDKRDGAPRGGNERQPENRGRDNREGPSRDSNDRQTDGRGRDGRDGRPGSSRGGKGRQKPRDQKQQSNRPAQSHKAVPITGKSHGSVSEEADESNRIANAFDNNRDDAPLEAVNLPPEAHPEEDIAPITEEQGNEAAAMLQEMLSIMGLDGLVVFAHAGDGSARLNIDSENDGGILIGKRGVTLNALQYLINRMIVQSDGTDNTERLVVDVGGYVDRRHAMLVDMAVSMARRAKDTRRNVRLKPLSPQERRIVHLALENDPQVRTYSMGDSLFRSIVINPQGARRDSGNQREQGRRQRPEQQEMDPAQFGDA